MKTAVFDLDGTLVDTSVDMIAAANAILGAEVLDPAQDAAIAFAGGRAMLRIGSDRAGSPMSDADIDAAYAPFLDIYSNKLCVGSVPYPSAVDVVSQLTDAGWTCAICTNKPEHLARRLMKELAWYDPFLAIIGADSLSVRKPHPAPVLAAIDQSGGHRATAVMVGDTDGDVAAAQAADIPSVLVEFGAKPLHAIETVPTAFCRDWRDMPRILDSLLDTHSAHRP